MKMNPWFAHPQAILGVYNFLLSDEYSQNYINKHPDASELYNGSGLYSSKRRKSYTLRMA